MSNSKRLVVNLSETLYNELNKVLQEDCKKSSEFIREAIILYIKEKKRLNISAMEKGYKEMAQLNLEFAEMGFASDMKDFKEYEAKLSESDLADDNISKKRKYILC
jgi:CopG family transcriptional regulator/antitoxin EndoAI